MKRKLILFVLPLISGCAGLSNLIEIKNNLDKGVGYYTPEEKQNMSEELKKNSAKIKYYSYLHEIIKY